MPTRRSFTLVALPNGRTMINTSIAMTPQKIKILKGSTSFFLLFVGIIFVLVLKHSFVIFLRCVHLHLVSLFLYTFRG